MSERRLIESSTAASRIEAAMSWLASCLETSEVLILSNHLESGDHLTRLLALERGSLFGLRRLTLDAFAYQLAVPEMARQELAPHSLLAQEAMVARIVHEARTEDQLGPYASVAHWPGFARALTATLGDLRLHGIDSDRLRERLPHMETLARLLSRYEKAARRAKVADRAAVFEWAARDGSAPVPFGLVGLPTLFLDVLVATPLEEELIAAVAERAPRVLATVPRGDEVSRRSLERALSTTVEPAAPPESIPRATRQLQEFLFSGAAPEENVGGTDVIVLSAPGEAQEAVEVARAIHAEAERGVPFDSMAILLRSPEAYTPLIEDALARASIPAYFASGTLRPDPAGRAFLTLLDCAAEELSATRFAEYVSLGQLPEIGAKGSSREQGRADALPEIQERDEPLWIPPRHDLAPATALEREPVQLDLFAEPERLPEPDALSVVEGTLRAPWRWERLLVDAAVIGGRERWERRLEGLDKELALRLQELDDPEGTEAAAIRHQREDLGHLSDFALPIIGRLAELPQRATWGTWLDLLQDLARNVLVTPDGVLSLLEELRPMESVGPVELFEVREVLSERLTLLSQEPPRYRYGHVWIAPIEAARGKSFEVVLIPGLAERMFPRKIVEDPLLLDADRKRMGARLPLQDDRIASERRALHLAVGAAHRKVILSYPSIDLQKGRAKVPSFYLLEVARASQGELPDFETLEREAAASSGARLGWPAPREDAYAIDDTEHDLAFLANALRHDVDDHAVRGSGRYLMNVNACLARSLRARYQKSQSRFTPADGMMDPSTGTKGKLGDHRLAARPYSVTSLEKYAACPYRFFLNAIMRLRPRETAEHVTHLDPLTYGRILHEAQYAISLALERERELPIRPESLSRVLEIAETVFRGVETRFAEELAPAIPRIWRDELQRIRADLRGWLRREAQTSGEWIPHRREFTFGMRPRGPADPASVLDVAVLESGLRLRGAIDLVERRADGKHRVTDHKSGRAWVPPDAVVNGGETLQPILYALAYESVTGEEVAASRLYYCTERGGFQERPIEPDEEALAVVAEFQRRLDKVIEEGFFPASPKPPLGCTYCDYLPVCGPRAEIVAERKQKDPRLSPLNWLRSLR